jgi:hypothetical protein
MIMFKWLKKIGLAIINWPVERQTREAKIGRHRTPDGMLSTAQTINQLQAGWGL